MARDRAASAALLLLLLATCRHGGRIAAFVITPRNEDGGNVFAALHGVNGGLRAHRLGGGMHRSAYSYSSTSVTYCHTILSQSEDGDEGDDSTAFSVTIGRGTSLDIPPGSSLSFPRALLVEGRLTGNIDCSQPGPGTLVRIAEGGEFRGGIDAVRGVEKVEVFGRVVGRIDCQSVIVGPGAEVYGDICSGSVSIEGGATIQGTLRCGTLAPPAGSSSNLMDDSASGADDPTISDLPDITDNTFGTDNPISRLLNGFSHGFDSSSKNQDKIVPEIDDSIEMNGFDATIARLNHVEKTEESISPKIGDLRVQHDKTLQEDGDDWGHDDALRPTNHDSKNSIQSPSEPTEVPDPTPSGGDSGHDNAAYAAGHDSVDNQSPSATDISEPIPSEVHDEHMDSSLGQLSQDNTVSSAGSEDRFVDNFGNPLLRGATDEEVETLRRNRELVREAREYMEKHARERSKRYSNHQAHPGPCLHRHFGSGGDNSLGRTASAKKGPANDKDSEVYFPPFLKD